MEMMSLARKAVGGLTLFCRNQEGSPRSIKKYQEVSRSIKKYQEVSRSIKKYQEVSRSIKKYQEVSRSIKKYQEVGILGDPRRSSEILGDPRRSMRIPFDCLRLFKLCCMGSARHAACREDMCKAWTAEETMQQCIPFTKKKVGKPLVDVGRVLKDDKSCAV